MRFFGPRALSNTGGSSPLARRGFRLYFAGRALTQFGNQVAPVALAFTVLGVPDAGAQDVGVVLAAQIVPQLVVLLVGGALADQWDRRLVMIAADLVQGAAQLATAVLVLTGVATLWSIVLLQVGYGLGAALFNPASDGFVKDLVPPHELQPANALLSLTRSVSGFLGPAVAAGLFVVAAPAWGLVVDAVTFLLSAVLLAGVTGKTSGTIRLRNLRRDMADGWSEFVQRRWLWVLVVDASVYHATVTAVITVVGPQVAQNTLGGASAWATILLARSVGVAAAGVLLLRWSPPRPMVVARLALLAEVPFLVLLVVPAPMVAVACCAGVGGMTAVGFGILWRTILQQHVPGEKLSRVSAYDHLGSLLMAPVGLVAVGRASSTLGPPLVVGVVVGVQLVAATLVILVPEVRRLQIRRT